MIIVDGVAMLIVVDIMDLVDTVVAVVVVIDIAVATAVVVVVGIPPITVVSAIKFGVEVIITVVLVVASIHLRLMEPVPAGVVPGNELQSA